MKDTSGQVPTVVSRTSRTKKILHAPDANRT
jgi:hypothetical protein